MRGLRRLFFFVILVALFFTFGTIIGSLSGSARIPVLPDNVRLGQKMAEAMLQNEAVDEFETDPLMDSRKNIKDGSEALRSPKDFMRHHQLSSDKVTQPSNAPTKDDLSHVEHYKVNRERAKIIPHSNLQNADDQNHLKDNMVIRNGGKIIRHSNLQNVDDQSHVKHNKITSDIGIVRLSTPTHSNENDLAANKHDGFKPSEDFNHGEGNARSDPKLKKLLPSSMSNNTIKQNNNRSQSRDNLKQGVTKGSLISHRDKSEDNLKDNLKNETAKISPFHTHTYTLPNLKTAEYVKEYSLFVKCLIEGTDFPKTEAKKMKECVCLPGWHGISCSVPDVVFHSNYPNEFGVMLASRPKRIIYTMPFSHEFDLLEAKMDELYQVVDVFLILESNYTAAGKPKERLLLNKLQSDYLKQYQNKIVYISLDYFPKEAYMDGWVIDQLLRDHIGKIGLRKVLKRVRDDDIIVVNDADEIPLHETLLFLKVNTGYPQPVGFKLRHNVYGHYWEGAGEDRISEVYGAVSMATLKGILHNSVYKVRSSNLHIPKGRDFEKFLKKYRVRLKPWSFGSSDSPAGWHCSWCFNPKGIQTKLHSAHVSDEPRYGKIEGKDSIKYIQHLVKTGMWFDDKTKFTAVANTESRLYAPALFLKNWKKYVHLLYLRA